MHVISFKRLREFWQQHPAAEEPLRRMIGTVDNEKYGALLAAIRPAVITDEVELERLTEEVNRLVTRGIKETCLCPEEEKLLALLTRLIEDYEQQIEPINEAVSEAA
jgi:hypothetical protein